MKLDGPDGPPEIISFLHTAADDRSVSFFSHATRPQLLEAVRDALTAEIIGDIHLHQLTALGELDRDEIRVTLSSGDALLLLAMDVDGSAYLSLAHLPTVRRRDVVRQLSMHPAFEPNRDSGSTEA